MLTFFYILSISAIIGSFFMLLAALYVLYQGYQANPYFIKDNDYGWIVGKHDTKAKALLQIEYMVNTGEERSRYSLTRFNHCVDITA